LPGKKLSVTAITGSRAVIKSKYFITIINIAGILTMKRLITLLLVLLVLSTFVPFKAMADFKKTKIAILDFKLQGHGYETENMGVIVAEWFITAFVKEGRFEVVERGLLKKILDEQKLGMTGVIDETTATKVGKLLGVKAIISGSVMKLENILEINARIIDIESASIVAAENVKSSRAAQLQDLVVQMSEKIVNGLPPKAGSLLIA